MTKTLLMMCGHRQFSEFAPYFFPDASISSVPFYLEHWGESPQRTIHMINSVFQVIKAKLETTALYVQSAFSICLVHIY